MAPNQGWSAACEPCNFPPAVEQATKHGYLIVMKASVHRRNFVALCVLASVLALAAHPIFAVEPEKDSTPSEFDKCAAISDTQARLACIKNLIGDSRVSSSQLPKGTGWRLITRQRTGDADTGTSIIRTPDTSRSDENLAGVMLRCKEPNDTELHIAVVSPYSPRTNTSVSLQIGARQLNFPARVGPGGTTLILPAEAVEMLAGHALQGAELKVEVGSGAGKTVGVIPLNGLDAAYAEMMAACRLGK